MKRILVPVDFSPYSEKAQHLAARLAKRTGAKVRLLHCVYTPLEWNSLTVRQQEKYPETVSRTVDAEINLAAVAEERAFQDLDLEFRVVHGIPYRQIVSQANQFKADLVVMGTHGNEKAERPFVGSNSQRVIRMASCPVLSVKPDAPVKAWKNVVFAADFGRKAGQAFEQVAPLLDDLNSRVHLLFINTPAHFVTTPAALENMEMFGRSFPNRVFTHQVFNHHDLHAGIMAFLKSANPDCLIMATHDREHAAAYQVGDTEAVLFHTHVPVLSLR